jgi:WD40 repeat protein
MPQWSVNVESARRGGVERARLMMHVLHPYRLTLLFVDADSDEVFRLDVESPSLLAQPLALSHDGTRILRSNGYLDTPETDLVCHELATGRQRSYGGLLGLHSAAFSPDGREVAASTSDLDGLVTLAVLDLDSGEWRRLSASDRLTAGSPTVTWSPDGKFIVVNYYSEDDAESVAVVDAGSGDLVEAHEGICLIDSSNGVWLDAARLLLVGDDDAFEDSPFSVLNVSDGSLTGFGERREEGLLQAVVGDALLWTMKSPSGSVASIEVSDLDGSGRRVITTVSPELMLGRIEVAPAVWTAL